MALPRWRRLANSALPYLLSEEFFRIKAGSRRSPMFAPKMATLVKIGPATVPAIVDIMKRPTILGSRGFNWHKEGMGILQEMSSDAKCADAIGATLIGLSKSGKFESRYVDILNLLDKDKSAAIARELDFSAIGAVLEKIEGSRGDAMTMKLGVRGDKCVKYYKILTQLDDAYGGERVLDVIEAELDRLVKADDQIAKDYEKASKALAVVQAEAIAKPTLIEDEKWKATLDDLKKQTKEASDAQWKNYGSWVMLTEATAMLGEKAIPLLVKQLDQGVGVDTKQVSGQLHTVSDTHIAKSDNLSRRRRALNAPESSTAAKWRRDIGEAPWMRRYAGFVLVSALAGPTSGLSVRSAIKPHSR